MRIDEVADRGGFEPSNPMRPLVIAVLRAKCQRTQVFCTAEGDPDPFGFQKLAALPGVNSRERGLPLR